MKSFYCFLICLCFFVSTPAFAENAITDADRKAVADLGIDYPSGETYGGIGLSWSSQIVSKVAEGYPAHSAGIKVGDKILQVNGTKIEGDHFESQKRIIELVRGEPGTKVTLVMERKGESKPITFDITRVSINSSYFWKGAKYYEDALKVLHPLADKGMPEAQNGLGVFYEQGLAVKQDEKQAAEWYSKSAEQDNPQARYNLGRLYYDGRGVAQNGLEALKLMHKSAEQGNDQASEWLADTYAFRRPRVLGANGEWVKPDYRGIQPDREEAIKWYRKLAEKGNRKAQYRLFHLLAPAGLILANDKANRQEACFWSSVNGGYSYEDANDAVQAAPGAGADILKRVAEINSRHRDHSDRYLWQAASYGSLMKSLTVDEIGACRKRAHEWKSPETLSLQAKAEQGDADAQYNIGGYYQNRRGESGPEYRQANIDEAEKWFLKAAEQGHTGAREALANMYAYDIYGREDKKAAFKWYKASMEKEINHYAASYLAHAYLTGEGSERDLVKAYMWQIITEASITRYNEKKDGSEFVEQETKQRDEIAKAMMPEQVAEAQKLTLEWLTNRAEKVDRRAQHALGRIYATGTAGKQDLPEAYFWLLVWEKGGKSPDKPHEWTVYTAKQITPEQAAAMQKRADEWKPVEGPMPSP